jgi:hypothetical protein
MTDPVSHPQRGLFVARETTRVATLCLVVGIAIACAGCENETDRKARETEALQAKYDAAVKAENVAMARALAERARADREASSARAIETHAESEEAFARYVRERPSMTDAEEGAATELGVARLRSRMTDPESMQLRNAHMNGARNAMCAEVNYKQDGNYVGFRRAYVTVDAVSVEPAAEEVTHRVFDLNFKRIGCDSPAARS